MREWCRASVEHRASWSRLFTVHTSSFPTSASRRIDARPTSRNLPVSAPDREIDVAYRRSRNLIGAVERERVGRLEAGTRSGRFVYLLHVVGICALLLERSARVCCVLVRRIRCCCCCCLPRRTMPWDRCAGNACDFHD